jgi:hypothetical protein
LRRQRAYSKHNPRWRDGPNRDKAAYVDRIRTAKKELGGVQRAMAKLSKLFQEIAACVEANRALLGEKTGAKLGKKAPKLESIKAKRDALATKCANRTRASRGGRATVTPVTVVTSSPNQSSDALSRCRLCLSQARRQATEGARRAGEARAAPSPSEAPARETLRTFGSWPRKPASTSALMECAPASPMTCGRRSGVAVGRTDEELFRSKVL